MKKFVLGLTGGIASGKSFVSAVCEKYGLKVVDADVVSKEVMSGKELICAIDRDFPGCVKDGKIDRIELKKQAFSTPEMTEKLNKITHSAILSRCEEYIRAESDVVVFVVPLMFETGAEKLCDAVINVSCDLKTRIERLKKRDNIDEELAKSIISRQMSDFEREKHADIIINNDSDLAELERKTVKALKNLRLIE